MTLKRSTWVSAMLLAYVSMQSPMLLAATTSPEVTRIDFEGEVLKATCVVTNGDKNGVSKITLQSLDSKTINDVQRNYTANAIRKTTIGTPFTITAKCDAPKGTVLKTEFVPGASVFTANNDYMLSNTLRNGAPNVGLIITDLATSNVQPVGYSANSGFGTVDTNGEYKKEFLAHWAIYQPKERDMKPIEGKFATSIEFNLVYP